MDNRRIAKRLSWVIGAGFCLIALFKLLFLLDAARAPNAGTGHTQPFLFAPAVSRAWSYITDTQMMILAGTTIVVLLLAAAMFIFEWRGRSAPLQEPGTDTATKKSTRTTPQNTGRAFGKR